MLGRALSPLPPAPCPLPSAPCPLPSALQYALPDGNSVTVRGQVKLPLRDIGYAVRFIDVDERTQAMIEQALDYAQAEREQHGVRS